MSSTASFAKVRPARLAVLSLLFGLNSACQGPSESPPLPPEDARRPTLGEIFLEPPISGYAPSANSLSPDGEWLVLRWSPDAVESGDAKRRLLRTSDPAASAYQGIPFAELFPAPVGAEEKDSRISSAVWAPDRMSEQTLLAVAQGRSVWLYEPETGERVQLYTPPTPPAPVEKSAQEEPEASEEEAQPEPTPLGRIVSLSFSPDGRTLRFSDRRELYSVDLGPPGFHTPVPWDEVRHHSSGLSDAALTLQWSKSLHVVFDPELNFTDESDEDAELPDDEDPPRRQLEHRIEGRRVTLAGMAGMEWLESARISPDGRFIFGREVDRSGDPAANLVPDYLTKHVSTRETRTRLADDRAAPWQLWMWNSSSGERVAIEPFGPPAGDEASTDPSDEASSTSTGSGAAAHAETSDDDRGEDKPRPAPWFRSVGWAPQVEPGAPARFAFEVYSEDFRELAIWVWTEGFCERVWSERDPRWIGGPCRYSAWTADGKRLIVGSEAHASSTTPGRAQIFAIAPDTKTVRQLTEVAGEVSAFKRLDAGGLVVRASGSNPAERTLFRLSRADVQGPTNPAIIPEPEVYAGTESGWNELPLVSRDGARIVFEREARQQPGELWRADFASAERLTHTTPAAFRRIDWIEPVAHQVQAPDGATIHAHVYLPRGVTLESLGAGGPRATIVFIHGAGYLQNVTDSMTRYPLNMMFHSRLADLGYPVIDVDYRGSAGYGQDFRTKLQYHLGGLDLDDIHAVVDDLAHRGLVDPERVGCYGGSYGGFLTLMALFTAPERWAAGAALRSVTDWRTYNPGYTQPRLGRPSTHSEAYTRSSPIDLVDGLEDPLLLLHGLMDRNVFAQDTIRLMEELIDRGLEFDAMLYPSQGHGFRDGPHWLDEYRRIERFLLEHLGPPQRAP